MNATARKIRDAIERAIPAVLRPLVLIVPDDDRDAWEVVPHDAASLTPEQGKVVMAAVRRAFPKATGPLWPDTLVHVHIGPTIDETLPARPSDAMARRAVARAQAAMRREDCRHALGAILDASEIYGKLADKGVRGQPEYAATLAAMRSREPEVGHLAAAAYAVGARGTGAEELRRRATAFLDAHNARKARSTSATERLDPARGPIVVDQVLAKIDGIFEQARVKGVPGVEAALEWLSGNRLRAGAKIARKLGLSSWTPSADVWASVVADLRRDPGQFVDFSVVSRDAIRQLAGYDEYVSGIKKSRAVIDELVAGTSATGGRPATPSRPAPQVPRRIEPERKVPYRPKGPLPYAFVVHGFPRVAVLDKAPEEEISVRGQRVAAAEVFAPFSKFDELCRQDYASRIQPFIVTSEFRRIGVPATLAVWYPQDRGTPTERIGQGLDDLFWQLWTLAHPDEEAPDLTLDGPLGVEGLDARWQPFATQLRKIALRDPPRVGSEFASWVQELNDQVKDALETHVDAMSAAWAPVREAYACWRDEVFAQAVDNVEARRLAEELPAPNKLAPRGFDENIHGWPGASQPPASATRGPVEVTEHWTIAQRTKANLAAMELASTLRDAPNDAERQILMGYSGWGGLSIRNVESKLPAGFPHPDPSGLIHEFYTPAIVANEIARVVRPLLGALPTGDDGVLQAVEPSAGIGRMLNAFEGARIEWHAVEWSELSYRMLRALRPEVDLTHSSFETWVTNAGRDLEGKVGLVVSNPPYGARGASITDDPDRSYREKMAYHYFLRRALDLLAPGGLGVFLVPGGFLSGKTVHLQGLREKVLKRHHLAGAFRLPSVGSDGREAVFPGAMLVVDVLFFRARAGELDETDPGDAEIIAGDYFALHPRHVLGVEVGKDGGEDDQTKKPRWGYQIKGDFTRLPDLVERPICSTCRVGAGRTRATGGKAAPPRRSGVTENRIDIVENIGDLPEEMQSAIQLGMRVDRYLADLSGDPEKASMAWLELNEQLQSWVRANGTPRANVALAKLAKTDASLGASRFLAAFEPSGALIPGLRSAPAKAPPRWRGSPGDIVGQAAELFKRTPRLTMADLLTFHMSVGGSLDARQARAALHKAGWALDGDRWDEWVPPEIYYTGALWPRVDRAMARMAENEPFAREQVDKLMAQIKPAMWDDLSDVSIRDGWIPLNLINDWFNQTYSAPHGYHEFKLERDKGLVTFAGRNYEDLEKGYRDLHADAIPLLGCLNHDKTMFKLPKDRSGDDDEKNADKRRIAKMADWSASFAGWVTAYDHQIEIMHAYNRQMRGFVQPTTNADPLPIVRWSSTGLVPHAHQTIGARRVLENRRGMLAFDVGVGKTLTGLMILARARQEGWAKRPVLLVPNSIVWKWHRDIKKSLPDYRVGVIGSTKSQSQRGARLDKEIALVTAEWVVANRDTLSAKAQKEIRLEAKSRAIVSKTDQPADRAAKWTKFQAGEYDCVLVTYSVFNRTRMNASGVREYAEAQQSIQRELTLRRRNAKGRKKVSEREDAILREGMSAWVAEQMELPAKQSYDPGITWDDLNVDFLLVDEAQNFKNLYLPEDREGGVPRFMGNPGDGSKRAWQLDFRAASVRRRTGGTGVVLLSATPAKNSPLEFYNIIQYIDPEAWHRIGIRDPEGFIDRFMNIQVQSVLNSKMEVEERGAVVGFKNLDSLRDVIFRYGDFKTAKDVGLKLPEPKVDQVWVDMDSVQDEKYDRYVSQIEAALSSTNPSDKAKILGLLARMSLVAIHPLLDMGYDWKSADGVSDASAPKFDAMAERILANRNCGHIVFCENLAAHRWIYKVLVDSGIPAARIAFLNAEAVPGAAERQQIAMDFNGNEEEELEPKYDVVICNSVAYEGIDLQTRTCAIHHIDLPWEPATLEQRNGRGVRQGNTQLTIVIYYYMSRRSQDGLRFNLIDGKAGWMRQLITSMDKETNNPGAQAEMTPEDVLMLISRNPEQTKARLEAVKAQREAEAKAKIALEASRSLRAVNARFRNAERPRVDEAERVRLTIEAQHRLNALRRTDPEAWPFGNLIDRVETEPILVIESGGPLWSGLRLGIASQWNAAKVEYIEIGDVSTGPWFRPAGEASWKALDLKQGPVKQIKPESYNATFPASEQDDTVRAIQDVCMNRLRYSGDFAALRWDVAPPGWADRYWNLTGKDILEALAKVSYWNAQQQRIPVVTPDGFVRVGSASTILGTPTLNVLPPTDAGWRRFLELAPKGDMTFTQLAEMGKWWWNRSIPRTLLVERDGEAQPESEMVAKLERRAP